MATVDGPADRLPTVWVGIESGKAGHGSPESQLKAIGEHPAANADGRFCVGKFAESGKSGFKAERGPELAAAIATAKAAAAEHGEAEVWVFHTSRLARGSGKKGQRSYMKLWADLFEADVQVRSVTDDEFATRPMLVGFASEQNHKYSADLSVHVKRGKVEQKAKGERAGGPLPDGYVQRVERDDKGKVVAREFDYDPTRRETIDRMFALLREGIPDARAARALNDEGHRTASGGYWSRRTVADKARNAWYAGAVVWYRGTEREEVIWHPPTPHPTYLSREDFERLERMREGRDRAVGADRKPGRPNKRHLLANLLYCERCESKMRATTSSYTRKDGTKNHSYICDHVHLSDGQCDAPVVNGEVVDREVAEHLTDLFRDGGDFLARVGVTRSAALQEAEAAREREGKRLRKLRREVTAIKGRVREVVSEGETRRAAAVEGVLLDVEEEVEQVTHRIAELDAVIAAEPDPADQLLDIWGQVKAAVDDALGRGGVADIRAGIAESFERFTVDTTAEGIGIRAFLRVDAVSGVERLREPVEKGSDSHE